MVLKVGTANRPILGMNWSNSAKCGSRSSNWNNPALNLNTNQSAQGVTETKGLAETKGLTLRLAVSTWLHRSRIHYGGSPGLVGRPDALGSIFA